MIRTGWGEDAYDSFMPAYQNYGGKSGVRWYEMFPCSIAVTFADVAVYLYDQDAPGAAVVDRMKLLADLGSGLNSYINRQVGTRYARKIGD